MVTADEWLDRTDWRKRSAGFGEVRIEEALFPPWKMVQMGFAGIDSGLVVDSNLWHWWHQLSSTTSRQPYLTILEVAEAEVAHAAYIHAIARRSDRRVNSR